jgi:hypothetical protein
LVLSKTAFFEIKAAKPTGALSGAAASAERVQVHRNFKAVWSEATGEEDATKL